MTLAMHPHLFQHGKMAVLDNDDLEEWRAHKMVTSTYITPLPIGYPFKVSYRFNKKSSQSTCKVYDLDADSLSVMAFQDAPCFLMPKGPTQSHLPIRDKTKERVIKRLSPQISLDLEHEWPLTIDIYLVLTAGAGPRRDETFATHNVPGRKQMWWEEDEVREQLVFPCWRKTAPDFDAEPDQQKWVRRRPHVYIYDVAFLNKAGLSRVYPLLHPSHVIHQQSSAFGQENFTGSTIYPVDLASLFSVQMFCQQHAPATRIGHKVMLTNPASRGCSNLYWSSTWFRPTFTEDHPKHGKIMVQPARRIRFN